MNEEQARRELQRLMRRPATDEDRPEPQHIGQPLSDLMDTVKYCGIETVYRGIEFRSRLEARWACFFDQCGWRWTYEPFDLDGWLPDFLIGRTLVEIKPFTDFEEFASAITKAELAMREQPRDLLLLGATGPEPSSREPGAVQLGWLGEYMQPGWAYGPALWGAIGREWDFCHADMNYRGRVTGHYDGSTPAGDRQRAEDFWAFACNQTKWKPSDGRGNR